MPLLIRVIETYRSFSAVKSYNFECENKQGRVDKDSDTAERWH